MPMNEPDTTPPRPPCRGPHRAVEARVWAAGLELDTAVALGRRHATRPAPTPGEAHDLAAALATVAEGLTSVVRQASGDVAGLAVMNADDPGGTYLAGPALEVASALDSAARLLDVVAEVLTGAAADLAGVAEVPVFPCHLARPVPAHRPVRVVAVV